LYDDDQFNSEKDKIQVLLESDEEIEENILSMKNELNKPIIIVGHITTYQRGPRYELLTLLERICVKHDILFINPMVEMTKRGINTDEVFKDENVISHYTEKGHSAIKDIYTEFLQRITPTVNKKTVILTFNEKFANVKQDSNNWFFGLGDLFRAVISMYQLSKKHNFQLIVDIQHHPLSKFLKKQDNPYDHLIAENKDNILFVMPNDVEKFILDSKESVVFFMTNLPFSDPITPECKAFVKELLIPNEEMQQYIDEKKREIPFEDYSILHYRLGDDELVRNSINENLLIGAARHLLEKEQEKNNILMSDSYNFKRLIKKNLSIFMFDIDIKHSGYQDHREQLKDTLFEFFIVLGAKKIHSSSVYGWPSGFVKIARDIYDVPLTLFQ